MDAIRKPTMRTKVLDESAVQRHRNLFCPEYDECLDIAVSGGWTSWSCERCPLAARTTRLVLLLGLTAASPGVGEPLTVMMP